MAEQRPSGAGLPRLLGRLTAELILRSPQYMSCIKLYEIDLRGNKIAAIENLGATENQFDSIDLSDNNIVKLEGFPKLNRLKQLLLNNNRLARIGRNLEDSIPNLETLVLTNNRISNLQDIDPLKTFPKLTLLSLVGNPVTTKPNYRLYVISRCKKLKVLDFKKVKQKEREEAAKLFPTEESAAAHGTKTFEPEEDFQAAQAQAQQQQAEEEAQKAQQEQVAAKPKAGLTAEQMVAIKAAIANAATIEEISRLENALKTGHLPSELAQDDAAAGEQQPAANGTAADAMEE